MDIASETSHHVVDVREYPEYASGHIAGAQLVPLGTLIGASSGWDKARPLTLVCKSGQRSEKGRQLLASQGFTRLDVIDGGVDAWSAAGKPLIRLEKRPWALERQVRVAAGALVFSTVGLGYFVSRYFLLGAAFVGAGLVFAGISNTCLMGSMLAKLPWNRPADSAAPNGSK